MVILVDRVRIRVGGFPSALVVLPADEAGIDVDVRERDGAQTLEIKVEHGAVDLQEWMVDVGNVSSLHSVSCHVRCCHPPCRGRDHQRVGQLPAAAALGSRTVQPRRRSRRRPPPP